MDQHHEVERRHDEQALSTIAHASHPFDRPPMHQRAAEPELEAVEIELLAVDLRRCGSSDPIRGHYRFAVPYTVVKYELSELGEVAWAHAETVGSKVSGKRCAHS